MEVLLELPLSRLSRGRPVGSHLPFPVLIQMLSSFDRGKNLHAFLSLFTFDPKLGSCLGWSFWTQGL